MAPAEAVRRGVAAALPIPAALADVEEPPLGDVAAVESWAARVNLLCAVAAETASDEELPRLQAALGVLKQLGRLKDKAKTSADACEAGRLRLGEAVDLTDNVPPTPAVAAVAWSFFRLARILHRVVTDPAWLPDRSLLAVGFLATAGFLPVKAEVAEIVERIKAEE